MSGDEGVPAWLLAPARQIKGLIADLDSMTRDFEFVAAACGKLLEAGDSPDDAVVARALWEAVVISYNRAFASGVSHGSDAPGSRTRIPNQAVEGLSPELRAVHDNLRDERNRHIAHRDDDREQYLVHVILSNPTIGRGVIGTSVVPVRLVGHPAEYVEKVRLLAIHFGRMTQGQLDRSRDRLVREAEADLDRAYAMARESK